MLYLDCLYLTYHPFWKHWSVSFPDTRGNTSSNTNDSRLSTLTTTTEVSFNNSNPNQIANTNEGVKLKKKNFSDVYNIDVDLDLDEVVIAPQVHSNNASNTNSQNASNESNNSSNCLVHLSASRLKLLHDTTMIDTALDLDSLEESTSSSIGTHNSQIDLLKSKNHS